ncbi:unnamed protein product [Protopolystoma xenopodis]|uniref:Uncharacterized protein n=1 Tax=Protopolystoma xenopodis TaxID=117903 RepID=A0A448XLM5_9PLAT|nr:unnamed protein product [Protopolystoma xenopodis]
MLEGALSGVRCEGGVQVASASVSASASISVCISVSVYPSAYFRSGQKPDKPREHVGQRGDSERKDGERSAKRVCIIVSTLAGEVMLKQLGKLYQPKGSLEACLAGARSLEERRRKRVANGCDDCDGCDACDDCDGCDGCNEWDGCDGCDEWDDCDGCDEWDKCDDCDGCDEWDGCDDCDEGFEGLRDRMALEMKWETAPNPPTHSHTHKHTHTHTHTWGIVDKRSSKEGWCKVKEEECHNRRCLSAPIGNAEADREDGNGRRRCTKKLGPGQAGKDTVSPVAAGANGGVAMHMFELI